MSNLQIRTAITLATVLGIAGLGIIMPEVVIGQQISQSSSINPQFDELAEAERLQEQADELYNQGKYNEAIPVVERVLAIYKKVLGEEHPDVATTLDNLAQLYYYRGQYNQAELLYIQALEMRKHLLGEDHPDIAINLNNLAYLYMSQGRYSEAEPLFNQALEINRRLLGEENPDVAISLSNLAELYDNQGRDREAESFYLQALEINKRLLGEENLEVAINLNNLALLYDSQGRYREAEILYRQALEMRKNLLGEEHPDVATGLNNLAVLYDNQGRYREAEILHRQALEMRKRLLGEEHPDVATSLNNLAALYDSRRRYREAEPLYRQALEISKHLLGEKHPIVVTILTNLALLYFRQGDTINALNSLKQVLEVEEYNLAYNLAAGFDQQKRDYLTTLSGTTDITISLHLNSAPNNAEAANLALTTIFQRKGRILDVSTNSLQTLRQRLDSDSQKQLDEPSNIYSQLATLVYKQSETLPPEEYSNQIASLEQQAKQLEDKLSRESTAFRTQSQPVTLEAIQQLIPTDVVLVELIKYQPFNHKALPDQRFGEPHYAAYIISSQGLPKGIDLGQAETIDKLIEDFRLTLQDPDSPIEQVQQSARALDTILMQPLRQLIGNNRHLLISPDGALSLIPFEALVDENNRYLVESYSFTYLTSGRDLLRLQNRSPSQQPPVLIADPYFDPPGETIAQQPATTRWSDLSQRTFPPLPGTAQEAQAIATLLNVQPLTGSRATENAVKQVQSPKILHIATHGFFENTSETEPDETTIDANPLLQSGLVLAGIKVGQSGGDDGILTALETSTLNLVGTQLVVLSACEIGLGNIHAIEGIYGLRRALVLAGSESQLISLWKVADNATKDLMVNYYERLLENQGRSEALRQTQLEMLQGEEYSHPYYWAAFIPSGDWTPMER